MSPEPAATDPNDAPDEHGASLLVPPEVAGARRRGRERPADIGRYLLLGLGGTCTASASALWVTSVHAPLRALAHPDHLTALLALAVLAFGLTLLALGGALHFFLLRNRDRWPEQAHAWDEGIEVLLHDGELRGALWSDPKLALDVFVRPLRRAEGDESLLVWRMDSAIPPCDLSEQGLARLLAIVAAHKLRLAEFRRGRRAREPRVYEIRGRPEVRSFDGPMKMPKPARSTP